MYLEFLGVSHVCYTYLGNKETSYNAITQVQKIDYRILKKNNNGKYKAERKQGSRQILEVESRGFG